LSSVVLLFFYLVETKAELPRITLSDIPFYKFPCTGNITELTEIQQERCKGRHNNVYCKVFKLCLNFSFGNLYLNAYGFWRSKGFYPPRNYAIHSSSSSELGEAVEVQRPRKEELKNAISQIRRKASGDNLSLALRDDSDAEKIAK
ncbi:hypothetical protein PENTCL1PPCAC_12566, partial [Pristionchus entomophagus]